MTPICPITRSSDHPIPTTAANAWGDGSSPGSAHDRPARQHRVGADGKTLSGGLPVLLEESLQLADNMAQLIISLRDLGESGAPGGPSQSVLLNGRCQGSPGRDGGPGASRELRLQLHAEGDLKVCANPERLREAFQSLLAWIIQNSAGGASSPWKFRRRRGKLAFSYPPAIGLAVSPDQSS